MAPDPAPTGNAPSDDKPDKKKDTVASLCAQIPLLPAGDRAALRRLFLTRSEAAAGIVTGLLVRAGVPYIDGLGLAAFARWQLLAHVAAVLSGTGSKAPHHPGASLGRALHGAGYSDHRLMRLTSARGAALVDQIVRAARVLAAAGMVPVDLRALHQLSSSIDDKVEAARLHIARDYYAAKHASSKDAP